MPTLEFIPPITANAVLFYGSRDEMAADSPELYGFGFSDNPDWYATSDSKSDVQERPVADGAFGINHDWRTSLAISVKAWYRGPDAASVRAARNVLAVAISTGRPVIMRFTDEDESTERIISVRKVTPDDTRGGRTLTFSIDAVALDPIRYSPERDTDVFGVGVSGGGLLFPLGTNSVTGLVDPTAPYWDFGPDGVSNRISVTNFGTAETFPTIHVSGGLSGGFIITDTTTGQQVAFSRSIPVGSVITIDQRTGEALIDDQSDVSGNIISWDFFSIGPGETHIIQFAPVGTVTGTPQAYLTIQDASL